MPPPDPRFSFGDGHAVAIVGKSVVVDGDVVAIKNPDALKDRLFVAGTNDDKAVPLLLADTDPKTFAATKLYAATLGYAGQIDVDAKAKPLAKLAPPFEESVDFVLTAGGVEGGKDVVTTLQNAAAAAASDAITISGSSSIRDTPVVPRMSLALPGISSGIFTTVTWSGARFIVAYSAGSAVRVAPLRCTPKGGKG
jgi:hypothetical protein